MLEASKCEDADYTASMLQAVHKTATTEIQACVDNGTASFNFKDPKLESSKARLTHRGQELLNFALANAPLYGKQFTGDKAVIYALRAAGLAYGDGLEDL